MKMIRTLVITIVLFASMLVTTTVASASEMSSNVGINFNAPPKSPVKSKPKLPSTGEIVHFSMYVIGLLLVLLAVYLLYRKYRESRHDT